MNRRNVCLVLILAVVMVFSASAAIAKTPKYVFFFLGDGMSSPQIQATEAFLTVKNGGSATEAADLLKKQNRLNMSKMPVCGMQTTYDAHALMTDSASAGTAFACGIKTATGVIGMDDTKTINYKSIAQLAFEAGKKVGIVSSVSLDHATPASYYASASNRGYMNSIAAQMAATGYDFFGGGGLASPTGPYREGDTNYDVWGLLSANGYTVLNTRDSIMALKTTPKSKVVCINPWLQDSAAMPYAIDRPQTNLSLKEMTEVAIACLKKSSKSSGSQDEGFFLMVEGGKIDWACHANDAIATIYDMLDFDRAVGSALAFYRQYPNDTLIVVTGDHETGGMSIGHATTAYTAYYDRLLNQKCSFEYFSQNQWAKHKQTYSDSYDWMLPNNFENSTAMRNIMLKSFGLDWNDLNEYQKEKLEDAYDKSMSDSNDNSSDENKLLYGSYEPIIVTITHILNERASIGWTSYSHTGVPVPVFAKGQESTLFNGFYDNTGIAKKLADVMDLNQTLPVQK